MKTHPREILLYYNPDSSKDKKTVAHAQGLGKHIRVYTYDKAPSTSTSWKMIIESLGVEPKKLFNKAHPLYQEKLRGRDFNDEDWLNVISRNPQLMKAPIAIKGRKAVLCENPTDIYRL